MGKGAFFLSYFFVAELSPKRMHVVGLQMKLAGAIPYCETLKGSRGSGIKSNL